MTKPIMCEAQRPYTLKHYKNIQLNLIMPYIYHSNSHGSLSLSPSLSPPHPDNHRLASKDVKNILFILLILKTSDTAPSACERDRVEISASKHVALRPHKQDGLLGTVGGGGGGGGREGGE